MKKWDGYSTRGIVMMVISSAGTVYEISRSEPPQLFLLMMYAIVFMFGLFLIIRIRVSRD